MFVVWGLVVFAMALALEIVNYEVVVPRIVIDPRWSVNILTKCVGANLDEAFQNKSSVQNGIIGIGFGAYFGMVFFSFRNRQETRAVVTGEAIWKPFVRLLVILVVCGIVLLPYVFLTEDQIANTYVLMVFKTLLPTFAAGFLLFCGLFEYLFAKMNVLEIEEVHPQKF